MDCTYVIRELDVGNLSEAMDLVRSVFMEFEAPDYSDRGVQEFFNVIALDTLQARVRASELNFWAASVGGKIVGVLGLETRGHIRLLFVDRAFHRKGIARALLNEGMHSFRNGNCAQVTVNSSPYAVRAYERLGFTATDTEQCINGIRFTPMVISLVGR